MVDLDGNDITDLYFDVNYSEDETFKILIIEGSPKNDEIDTSNLTYCATSNKLCENL